MAAALGSVVVELSANVAKFESAMTKSAAIAEAKAREIDKSLSIVKTSLGVLGVGFLANATFDKIKEKILGAIESAAGLKDLSERTGASVEALSGLVAVAKLSGTGADELAGGLQKLSKSLIDAQNGGTKTSETFKAIGISVDSLKGRKPDELFLQIALQLEKFQSGAEKTVAAQNLLGKSGANLLPVLHDLAIAGSYQVKVTDDQAEAAKNFEDNQKRLAASSNAVYKIIALEAVPILDSFTKVLLNAQNETGGLTDKVKKLAKENTLRDFFEDVAIGAAKFVDVLSILKSELDVVIIGSKLAASVFSAGTIKIGKSSEIAKDTAFKDAVEERAKLAKEFEIATSKVSNGSTKYEDALRAGFATRRKVEAEAKKGDPASVRPTINLSGTGNKNAAAGPKDDPAQKKLDGQLKAREDFIASEKKLLADREQQLSFYTSLEFITLKEELETKRRLAAETLASEEKTYNEEAVLLKARIRTADTEVKRQDARNKLQEVEARRKAAQIEQNGKILQSTEALLAIQRKFDLATEETARQADKNNDAARFTIDLLGKSTLEVQQLTSAKQIQLALDERIFQLHKQDADADVSGAISDAAQQQERASKLIEESYNRQRSGALGVGEAIRKYGEDASNTAAQIESTLGNAFKGAEDALVQFASTGKISFSGLTQSILADLARIQARNLIASLTGGESGVGGLLSKLFGGGGGASAAASGIGDSGAVTGFLTGLGFATGGNPPIGKASMVGENGPELFVPNSAGTIIPNNQLGGGAPSVSLVQNIQIDSRSDAATIRESIQRSVAQAKAEIADSISRGSRQYTRLA